MLEVCAEHEQELPFHRISMEFCHGEAEQVKAAVADGIYTVMQ